MILVSGILADGMIELMCARLENLGFEYILLDETRFPGEFDVTWQASRQGVTGCISTPKVQVSLEDITGVYARYVHYVDGRRRDGISVREEELLKCEYQASLMQLYDALPCVVVNHVKASTSNDSKMYQQLLIRSFGLLAPRTLVTTLPDEAEAFYERCGKRVIFKSLSGVRSIVRRLEDGDLPRLKFLQNCPTQFQELVDGVDIRVHTVGTQVFATELVSEATDYRYAARSGASLSAREIEVPPEVASACLGLTKACGLMVAGIDLRRTPGQEYYCFEVNPSPGFIFYERATGQPISEAVAKLLRGNQAPRERGGKKNGKGTVYQ
jgi:glutathione synthase/RimK-type ligase-like ATP-grasp enzyme